VIWLSINIVIKVNSLLYTIYIPLIMLSISASKFSFCRVGCKGRPTLLGPEGS
jgi:hypothetical protein